MYKLNPQTTRTRQAILQYFLVPRHAPHNGKSKADLAMDGARTIYINECKNKGQHPSSSSSSSSISSTGKGAERQQYDTAVFLTATSSNTICGTVRGPDLRVPSNKFTPRQPLRWQHLMVQFRTSPLEYRLALNGRVGQWHDLPAISQKTGYRSDASARNELRAFLQSCTGAWSVGGDGVTPGRGEVFDGWVAGFRVYGRILGSRDIQRNYAAFRCLLGRDNT
eukprot:TRINITY_DN2422_c0_g1_i2.p1 TRINITY_DN2422_c0_g1~~TRINITY_DN2422_c0_g1_i2.p1  ORF type:complete len:223 (-),score=22.39 TRINITY_DN2422_c0_g1_i2:273-941(-)